MTFKSDMHIVMMLIKKGHSAAVIEAIDDMTVGGIQTYQGSTDVGQKGLFGVNIKEDNELIICIAHSEKLDELLTKAIEAGELNIPGNGMCVSIPADRMYIADVDNEKPRIPQGAPAKLDHGDE